MKENLEKRTEEVPTKKRKENYFIKVMGYIMDGIKPDKNVSSRNKLVYSKFLDYD